MNLKIIKAEIKDAEEILKIQKLAYQIEAKRYNNCDIPPLKQTLEELEKQFGDHIILKAVADDKIIGTVRAFAKNGTCFIGRLAVHPSIQNQGIGTALMKEIENHYNTKRYELFVGSKSDNNIHLYEKLGYSIYQKIQHECENIEIFYMEKNKNI
ncbi:MAG: GNAT family N-acetyltransferase [Dissulfurispiraceae bacterium]